MVLVLMLVLLVLLFVLLLEGRGFRLFNRASENYLMPLLLKIHLVAVLPRSVVLFELLLVLQLVEFFGSILRLQRLVVPMMLMRK